MQTGASNLPAQRKLSTGQRGARGQSLVEFALSVTVLILVFSGLIDLGRAYYMRLNMNSMIGEGLHWAAAYPGCIKYGVAQNDTSSSNVNVHCKTTNSIAGRMTQENNVLDPNNWVSTKLVYVAPVGCVTNCTKDAADFTVGDTIELSTTYKVPLITPVMRGLFGNSLDITVDGKEVIRGSGIPGSVGGALTHATSAHVDPVTDAVQVGGTNSCTAGKATLSWTPIGTSGAVEGYHIYSFNPLTSPRVYTQVGGDIPNAAVPAITYDAPIDITMAHGDPAQSFAIMAYITYPGPPVTYAESDPFDLLSVTCNPVVPTTVAATCLQDGTGIYFGWTMNTPVDHSVNGYGMVRTSDNSNHTFSTVTGGPSFNATYPLGASTDWVASTYQVVGLNGGVRVPNASDAAALGTYPVTSSVNCAYNSHITMTIDDNHTGVSGLYFATNSPITYTIIITNTDASTSAPAIGLNFTDSFTAGASSPFAIDPSTYQWTCTASATAACLSGTTGSGSIPTNHLLSMPGGSTVTYTVTATTLDFVPPATANLTNQAVLSVPATCGTNCTLDSTNATSLTRTDGPKGPGIYAAASVTLTDDNPSSVTSYKVTPPSGELHTYTGKIKNLSSTISLTGTQSVTVTDANTGTAGFTFSGWQCTVTNNPSGTTFCPGGVLSANASGTTPFSANDIQLGPNGEVTITITGYSSSGDATKSLINTLTASGTYILNGSVNATDTDTYQGSVQLNVSYSTPSAAHQYYVGESETYTVAVSNAGPDAAVGTFTNNEASLGSSVAWSCAVTTGTATGCPSSGTGALNAVALTIPSGSTVTYTITGPIQSGVPSTLTNTSTFTLTDATMINSGSGGTPSQSASQTMSLDNSPVTDIGLTNSVMFNNGSGLVASSSYLPGNKLYYRITVSNHGPQDLTAANGASGTVTMTFTPASFRVSDGITFANCSTTCPTVASGGIASGTFTTSNFTIGNGNSITFDVVMTVETTASNPSTTATANVVGTVRDPEPPADSGSFLHTATANSTSVSAGNLDLSVAAGTQTGINATTSSYTAGNPGNAMTWTFTVANSSGTMDVYGAQVTFNFCTSNTCATGNNTMKTISWSCVSNSGANAVCTTPSGTPADLSTSFTTTVDLKAGASTTFTITGKPSYTTGELDTKLSVALPSSWGATESNTANNSAAFVAYNKVDLGVTISSNAASHLYTYTPAGYSYVGSVSKTIVYTAVVSNATTATNTNNVQGAWLDLALPTLANGSSTATWSCTPSSSNSATNCPGGASGATTNGTGALQAANTFNLKNGDSLTFTFTLVATDTVADITIAPVIHVSNTTPVQATDPNSANDTASVTDKYQLSGFVFKFCPETGNTPRTVTWNWYKPPAAGVINSYTVIAQSDSSSFPVTIVSSTITSGTISMDRSYVGGSFKIEGWSGANGTGTVNAQLSTAVTVLQDSNNNNGCNN